MFRDSKEEPEVNRLLEVLKAFAALSQALVGALEGGESQTGARLHAVDESDTEGVPGDEFAFDVATRFNERLLGNIDALDAALTAILAGVAAVAIFAVDKLPELAPSDERVALSVLGVSAVACIVGFAVGTPASPIRSRDIVDPRAFIPTFGEDPSAAVATAIQELTAAADDNARVRRWKRGLALVALVALLAGAVFVALARVHGR
ncbi:MAG: hypothetical protein WAN59_10820 [Candidatus Baltobacteraceae bacterium]